LLQSTDAGVLSWVTAGGGGAPADAQFVVLAADGELSAERVLTAGTNITFTDAGANGALTIKADSKRYINYSSWIYKGYASEPGRMFFTAGAAGVNSARYANIWRQIDSPNIGDVFAWGSAPHTVEGGGLFVMPMNGKLVSGSYTIEHTTPSFTPANEALRFNIVKVPCIESVGAESGGVAGEGGGYASATGYVQTANVSASMMYYHEHLKADAPDEEIWQKMYSLGFECTGSDSHLTASAGDMIICGFETVGDDIGAYPYYVFSVVFEVTKDVH
jgi:hypothetical protein